MKPLVSIIIPAYNAEKFLMQTVRSALSQTYINKEIIIVDDGSTDDTYTIAQELLIYPEVHLYKQSNLGASAARNKGFLESKGVYIQYLDADDLLAPSKIESQITLIESRGEYICAGKWKIFFSASDEFDFKPNDLWKDFDDPVDWLTTAWNNEIWMHPSAWLTPRKLIDEAGPWNESLSLHDDGEFFCRVLLKSKKVLFCTSALSYYRKGLGTSLSSIFSATAVESHYRICRLYEDLLLSVKNTKETRKACASNYMAFYYAHFPGNKALRKSALSDVARLGGANISPKGTDLFNLLKKIVGWKIAKRLERIYYR